MAKFTILSSDIQKIVNFSSGSIEKEAKNNLFFKVEKNKIFLFAKGLQVSTKFSFDAKIEKEGLFCINNSLFLSAIKEFKNDILEFSLEHDTSVNRYFLFISLKDLKIKLAAEIFKEEDVDFLLQAKGEDSFLIKLSDFLKASNQILHCIATGNERPNLSGIMMHTEAGNLNFVSTDGRKLGMVKIPFENKFEINELIMPKKLFEQITNLSSIIPLESFLNIQKVPNGLLFLTDKISIRSALIDGKFPQYKNVIPKNNKIIVDFKTNDLLLGLKRVSSIALKNDTAYFEIEINNNKLALSTEAEGNSARDEINITCSEGESFKLKIRVPLKSFVDLIDKISTEYCRFSLSLDQSPLIISPINDNFEVLFVIALSSY